jgi:hypothetical protein
VAGDPVLWAEQHDQFAFRRFPKAIDGVPQPGIDAALIGNEAHALPPQTSGVSVEETLQAGRDLGRLDVA